VRNGEEKTRIDTKEWKRKEHHSARRGSTAAEVELIARSAFCFELGVLQLPPMAVLSVSVSLSNEMGCVAATKRSEGRCCYIPRER
jgi:hypothetical protein